MEHKARVLCSNAARGNIHGVLQAFKDGADINSTDGSGMTPLCRAAYNGNLEMVEFLCSYGADLNRRDIVRA